MPLLITPEFNYSNRKDNQFYDHELEELLTGRRYEEGRKPGLDIAFDVLGKGDDRYTAELKRSDSGDQITLNATLRRDEVVYVTTMTAKRVKEALYELTELTFDNRKEKLDRRWEMSKVLGHIGEEQLKKGVEGKIAEPHKEKGKFGKLARFFDRLIPNDPYSMPMPPMM